MSTDSLFILAVLALNVAAAERLARLPVLRYLGSALLVIVLTAATANLGLIPTYSSEIPVYAGTFEYLAPLAIFWLLLRVDLRSIVRAGTPMIVAFLIGAGGTVAGVLAGMTLIGGSGAFGELQHALAGMFVGTYTGGSVNFNAVALEYGVVDNGLLYTGAAAVDSAATTVWMLATVALPRLLRPLWPASRATGPIKDEAGAMLADLPDGVRLAHVAVLLALGALTLWGSEQAAGWLLQTIGLRLPSILILTTVALVLAQLRPVQRLSGTELAGMLAVMFFLAVIGALCDLSSVAGLGRLGVDLVLFVGLVILVHGTIVFGLSALLRFDVETAAVASQANIGGSTSALALARSLGRTDLVLPGILVGSLGNALGTYLGFLVAAWMR